MRSTWANISERKILVSNFSVTRNSLREFHTLDWSLHVCALPEKGLRRRHVLKYTTQLPTFRRSSFQLEITFLSKSHAEHPSSTQLLHFYQHFLKTFLSALFINLTMCFPPTDNHSWSRRTCILEDVTSQNELLQLPLR